MPGLRISLYIYKSVTNYYIQVLSSKPFCKGNGQYHVFFYNNPLGLYIFILPLGAFSRFSER